MTTKDDAGTVVDKLWVSERVPALGSTLNSVILAARSFPIRMKVPVVSFTMNAAPELVVVLEDEIKVGMPVLESKV